MIITIKEFECELAQCFDNKRRSTDSRLAQSIGDQELDGPVVELMATIHLDFDDSLADPGPEGWQERSNAMLRSSETIICGLYSC